MKPKLNEQQIQDLRKEYLETGCTKTYLAKKYGVSLTNICRKLKDLPSNINYIDSEKEQQIIQLRSEGKSLRKIGKLLGIHFTTVRKYLQKNNIA